MASAANAEEVESADNLAKPPFLRRVQIRGYKSIAFCDVTLEPLTILVGRNGSGKSNFLDALAFLRDVVKFGVNEAVKRHGGTDAILCRLRKDRTVAIEVDCTYLIERDTNPWNATYRIGIDFPKNKAAKISHEKLDMRQANQWVGYTNEGGRVTYGAADDQLQQRMWNVKDLPFLDGYDDTHVPEFCLRLESLTAYNFQPEAIRTLQKPNPGRLMEKDGHNLPSVIAWLKQVDQDTFRRVQQYLSAIAEQVVSFADVKYGEFETVRFGVAGNGEPLEFDAAAMSDGTLRALAALMAVFQDAPPHGSPSVVGIEEPETALHPAAMRALVAALDEATLRTQVLLTTHSPDLLDAEAVKPANVRVVEMIDGRTHIGPVDAAGVEIVAHKWNTLGGLERDNLLEPDLDDRDRQQELERSPKESPA